MAFKKQHNKSIEYAREKRGPDAHKTRAAHFVRWAV